MSIQVSISTLEDVRPVPTQAIKRAVRKIASDYEWPDGEISIAIVDDATIRTLNRTHLKHDYATDVISFDLTDSNEYLEGEVIVSISTADRESTSHGWSGNDELLLYIIHGMLHVIGLRDKSVREQKEMREAERYYLQAMGVRGWEQHARPS